MHTVIFFLTGPCESGRVRLANGYPASRGVLEICVNGKFATVCADQWDNTDASIVCKELGYSPYGTTLINFAIYTE